MCPVWPLTVQCRVGRNELSTREGSQINWQRVEGEGESESVLYACGSAVMTWCRADRPDLDRLRQIALPRLYGASYPFLSSHQPTSCDLLFTLLVSQEIMVSKQTAQWLSNME